MKKLLCLLLTFALFLPAVFAIAQGTGDDPVTPDDAPALYFGADPDTAFKYFEKYWRACSFSNEGTEEIVTVEDGMPVMVLTYAAEPAEFERQMSTTVKLYYVKGALLAGLMEIEIPEGANLEITKMAFSEYLRGSIKGTLDLGEIGYIVELLGEAAHLQEGQDAWRYTLTAGETKTNAILTMRGVDGKLYVAAFPVQKNEELLSKTTVEISMMDLAGFAELDSDQKDIVRYYVQFLVEQQKKTIEEYITFVKNQKK